MLENWYDVLGYFLAHGLDDPRDMPIDHVEAVLWYRATENAQDPTFPDKLKAALWRPPPGAVPEGPWAPEAEASAFASLKAQVSGNAPTATV